MTEQQFQALAAAPKVVERLLRVFPKDRLDERLPNSTMTPREVVALLADTEQLILDRIRLANTKPGSSVPWYDPTDRAREHHYSDKDVFHEAEVYESRRQMTLDYLRDLTEADWRKTLVLEGKQEYSIDQYLGPGMAHDLERIGQISEHLATEAATIS